MSHDFVLFAPDHDEAGTPEIIGDGAWPQLRLRLDAEQTTTSELLERLRDEINANARFLPREGVELVDGAVHLRGDRCLLVSVTDRAVSDTAAWLAAVATDQHLGLATATHREVVLVGDEVEDFSTETATLDLPVVSPAALPHLLSTVKREQEEAESGDFATDFLIVTDLAAAETYLQTTYRPDGDTWLLEYRDGSLSRHFQVRVDTQAEVESAFTRWLRRDEGLKGDLPWQRLDLPEAAIDHRGDSDRQ